MSNLTKYEVMKYRHLSLLKELEKAGVSAKCDENGEWHIGVPQPASEGIGFYQRKLIASFIDGDTGLVLEEFHSAPNDMRLLCTVPVGASHARFCIRMDTPYVGGSRVELYNSSPLSFGQAPIIKRKCDVCGGNGYIAKNGSRVPCPATDCHYPFPFRCDKAAPDCEMNKVIEEYAREIYMLKADGEVLLVRAPEKEVPDWVLEADTRWNKQPNPYILRCVIDGDNVHVIIAGKEYNHIPYTAVLMHLLIALEAAIVSPSPAKVD